MKCKNCGHLNGIVKKICEKCDEFLEGYCINNVTAKTGYRCADGSFIVDQGDQQLKMTEENIIEINNMLEDRIIVKLIREEVKPVRIRWMCDRNGCEGEMESVTAGWTGGGGQHLNLVPDHTHECNKCGRRQVSQEARYYPKLIHEKLL